MKRTKEMKTKRLYVVVVAAALAVGMLAGCGKKGAEVVDATAAETAETEATVENTEAESVEESADEVEDAVVTPFLNDLEKYDSIISTLTTEQYYAFAGISDNGDVLLVADGVYDNLDGNMAAIDAVVYDMNSDGEIFEAGSVWSDGTAYPLAVYEDKIMFGGNHHMTMACVKDGAVVTVKEASEIFDEQGNATYFYNEGNIDEEKEVSDDSILKEMYETYGQAVVINFFPGEQEAVGEAEGDMELGDYPSNDFEARVGKTSFDSYDEIIGLLEGEEAYALVDVKGYDGQVLMVTDYTYDDLLGHIATVECTPYTMKSNGKCTADSALFSGGTANPVAIDDQGVIFTVTHTSVDKSCYGDNGTDNASLMVLASVYADEFDDNGDPTTVSGFVRTKNSLVDDDSVFLEGSEVDIYNQLFDEYTKTEPISFTTVAK